MSEKAKKIDYLFETSWEVCNKIGGIYTVLSSRAQEMVKNFKDHVIFIGPDVWKDNPSPWFKEDATLFAAWQKNAKKNDDLDVRVGRWELPCSPIVILVDFQKYMAHKNEIYGEMWNDFQVESMNANGDYDESCMFAYAAGKVIESFSKYNKLQKKNVIAHFNEWTTGMGLLYVKKNMPAIATLFTTHATTVGRSIAGNHKPLYSQLHNYNGDQMAKELNVDAKHSVEKQAAHHADCFTAVSSLTAKECKQLLGIEPFVTPNGFDNSLVPLVKTYNSKQKIARNKLIEVSEALLGYKLPKDVFLITTSGRYEYRNKGIDVYIDALSRLNEIEKLKKQVVAFIMVPAWVKGPRVDLQERLNGNNAETSPLPNTVITHELYNMESDSVLNQLRYLNMHNSEESKVKIIFVPSYLNGDDGIFGLDYYDLLIGMDLTVFPSYYEPWGYTPHESIAFSIPTVTTELSGFGQWMSEKSENEQDRDTVVVLERNDYNFLDVSTGICGSIFVKAQQKAKDVKTYKENAKNMANHSNWDSFYQFYLDAYQIALNTK